MKGFFVLPGASAPSPWRLLFQPSQAALKHTVHAQSSRACPAIPAPPRNAAFLLADGYHLERVEFVDQKWSAHVEIVGVFRRKRRRKRSFFR
jgi:hypothetical protein